jgi:hypothetical protein
MILVLFGMFGLAGAAAAVSYPVVEDQREEKAAKGIREKGETVCLFQSGTEDVRKTIGIGDVLIVYRKGGDREHREVGKIKVLSYAGEDYIKAEVVDGVVQTGDVARKGNVASLVISSSEQCK